MDKQWQSFNLYIFVATDVIQQNTSRALNYVNEMNE